MGKEPTALLVSQDAENNATLFRIIRFKLFQMLLVAGDNQTAFQLPSPRQTPVACDERRTERCQKLQKP